MSRHITSSRLAPCYFTTEYHVTAYRFVSVQISSPRVGLHHALLIMQCNTVETAMIEMSNSLKPYPCSVHALGSVNSFSALINLDEANNNNNNIIIIIIINNNNYNNDINNNNNNNNNNNKIIYIIILVLIMIIISMQVVIILTSRVPPTSETCPIHRLNAVN